MKTHDVLRKPNKTLRKTYGTPTTITKHETSDKNIQKLDSHKRVIKFMNHALNKDFDLNIISQKY